MKTLGTQEAIVDKVEPDPDASTITVAVRYDDGRVEAAALRADLVPAGLTEGDRVEVTRAALYRRWHLRRLNT